MDKKKPQIRFGVLVAVVIAADLLLTLLYTLLVPGLTRRAWSNTLCTSALIIGLLAVLPVFLDAGRGIALVGKMGATREEQHTALETERHKRERGMRVTFALALATVVVTLLSLLLA